MDSQDCRKESIKTQKNRRNSILKEVDGNEETVRPIHKVVTTSRRSLKRVSFADTTSIKEFRLTRDANTEWNHTYEEPVTHHDSSTSMEITNYVHQTSEIFIQEKVVENENADMKEKDGVKDFGEMTNFLSNFIGGSAGTTCDDHKENASAMNITCNYTQNPKSLKTRADDVGSNITKTNPVISGIVLKESHAAFSTKKAEEDLTCAVPVDIDMTSPVSVPFKWKQSADLEKSMFISSENEDSFSASPSKEALEMTEPIMQLTKCAGNESNYKDDLTCAISKDRELTEPIMKLTKGAGNESNYRDDVTCAISKDRELTEPIMQLTKGAGNESNHRDDVTCAISKDIELTSPFASSLCTSLTAAERAAKSQLKRQFETETYFDSSNKELKTADILNAFNSHSDMDLTCRGKTDLDSNTLEGVTSPFKKVNELNASEESNFETKTDVDKDSMGENMQEICSASNKASDTTGCSQGILENNQETVVKMTSEEPLIYSQRSYSDSPPSEPADSANMEMTEAVGVHSETARNSDCVSEDQISVLAEIQSCDVSKPENKSSRIFNTSKNPENSCSESFDVCKKPEYSSSVSCNDSQKREANVSKSCSDSMKPECNNSKMEIEKPELVSKSSDICIDAPCQTEGTLQRKSLSINTEFETVAVSPLVDDVFSPNVKNGNSSPTAVPDEILGLLTAPITNKEKHINVRETSSSLNKLNVIQDLSCTGNQMYSIDKDIEVALEVSVQPTNIKCLQTSVAQDLDKEPMKYTGDVTEPSLDKHLEASLELPLPTNIKCLQMLLAQELKKEPVMCTGDITEPRDSQATNSFDNLNLRLPSKRRSNVSHFDEPSPKNRAKDSRKTIYETKHLEASDVVFELDTDIDENEELIDNINIDFVDDEEDSSVIAINSASDVNSRTLKLAEFISTEDKGSSDKHETNITFLNEKLRSAFERFCRKDIARKPERGGSECLNMTEESSVADVSGIAENEDAVRTRDDEVSHLQPPTSPTECDTSSTGANDFLVNTFVKEYEEIEDSECQIDASSICLEAKNDACLPNDSRIQFCRLCRARTLEGESILMFDVNKVREGWMELQLRDQPLKIYLDLLYHHDHQLVVKADWGPQLKDLTNPCAKLGMKVLGHLIGQKTENLSGLHLCVVEEVLRDVLSAYELVMAFIKEMHHVQTTNITEFVEDGLTVTLSNFRAHLCISVKINFKKPSSKEATYPITRAEPIIIIGNLRKQVLDDALVELERGGKLLSKIIQLIKSYC